MFRIAPITAAALALTAAPAVAQSVTDCDSRAKARNLAEPWEENTATFADGDVRIAAVTMTEPEDAPAFLMILTETENGERRCRLVEAERDYGFYTIDMSSVVVAKKADGMLTLEVPVTDYADGPENPPPFPLTVKINRDTGEVTASTD